MGGTDPHLVVSGIAIAFGVLALCASAFTWFTSRAKKVRLVEDQVLEAVRQQRARAEAVEVRLSEWQVTIQGILAEVEEFFERTVKERKRVQQQATRAEQAQTEVPPFETLPRADQMNVVRGYFQGR